MPEDAMLRPYARMWPLRSLSGANATPVRVTVLRTICAWCEVVIREGAEPTSHGICGPCRETHFPKKAAK